MKRIVAMAMALALGVSCCAYAAETESEMGFKNETFTFRGSTWMSSYSDVFHEAVEDYWEEGEDYDTSDTSEVSYITINHTTLGGHDAHCKYHFDDKGYFISGEYSLYSDILLDDPQQDYLNFMDVVSKIVNKYGPWDEGGEIWAYPSVYEGKEDKYGEALVHEHLEFKYRWFAEDGSMISAELRGSSLLDSAYDTYAYYSPEEANRVLEREAFYASQASEDDGI